MPKVTIYVPDELKAEMDRAESQQPNWSAIAQEAFSIECQRVKTRKKGAGKMEKVVERLRASRDRLANLAKINGHNAGRDWAMEGAGYADLEQLAEWEQPSSLNYPLAEAVYSVFTPLSVDDPEIVDWCSEFWVRWSGTERPSDDFVQAFVEGARELFAEVKDKL